MAPLNVKLRQCRGKIPYQSEREAKDAARRMHKKKKAPVQHYQCQWCPWWHIGGKRSKLAGLKRSIKKGHVPDTKEEDDENF